MITAGRFSRGDWGANVRTAAPVASGPALGPVVSRVTRGPTGDGVTYELLSAGRTTSEGHAYHAVLGNLPRRVRIGNASQAYPGEIGGGSPGPPPVPTRSSFSAPVAPAEQSEGHLRTAPRVAFVGRRLPSYPVVR
ncbi:MAG: hypothetical protein M0Z69_12315 [Actinomycetota bacterium]|nr:hypothetical protein [Actinomycetota bacterium]